MNSSLMVNLYVLLLLFFQDPVTGEDISVYPALRRFFKMMGSFGVMLFMVRVFFVFNFEWMFITLEVLGHFSPHIL